MQEQFEIAAQLTPLLKCINNNAGYRICAQKQCVQPGIMCKTQNCKCKQVHKNCEYQIRAQKIIKGISQAKQNLPQQLKNQFQFIERNIDKMFDMLSSTKQQILRNKQFFGLSKNKMQFYNRLVKSQLEKINGTLIAAIKSQPQEQKNKLKDFYSFQGCVYLIRKEIFNLQKICTNLKQLMQPNSKFKGKSKITEDSKTLQEWIQPSIGKPIKSVQLLYRGSQNNFLASQFHKKCDNKNNTLVLAKTNFGKVIGGFTPNRWNQVNAAYYYDNTHKTFVFSLTNKQKMTQTTTNGSQSIYCHPGYGPTFGGGHDLYICDQSNIKNSSYGSLGGNFNNGNFKYKNQQTYTAWTGCTNGFNFMTEQYEVFQVICD